MSVLWVCLGAAVGAPLRYLTDTTIQRRVASPFPWGTFVVNADSTFAYETWRLLEGGAVIWAALNVVASIVTGLAAAAAGIGVGQLLFAS